MNHLESPPNLSLSLRKFWSCNQLRRKLMIEGVLIILWLIYLKSLKSNECQIGFWTFLRKCMRLINISSLTQPWTQAVRRVLAFLESHTWTFFAYNFNQQIMVLLTSVWNNDSPSCHAALDVVSRAYPVVWEEHLQTRSQSLMIGTSRLGDQTHRLHDGKKHRWSWLVWVQTEETEDLDDQGVRIPDQVRKIIPENRNYITDAWSSSSSHTHSSIERKKSTDSSGSVLKINLEIC